LLKGNIHKKPPNLGLGDFWRSLNQFCLLLQFAIPITDC
jgi:hypothetical protein